MTQNKKKYHIEKNTVQETLIIPLYGRKICSDRFPYLFRDPEAERICNMLDFDFAEKGKRMESGVGLFGALEVAQRQYDIATGVFYYFKTADLKVLFCKMAKRFPGAVLVLDACNRMGAKMMTKTWLKEAGISDVNAFFSVESHDELKNWSKDFKDVSAKSYMRGYRDIYKEVGFLHKLMIIFCDKMVKMIIVKIAFSGCLHFHSDNSQGE